MRWHDDAQFWTDFAPLIMFGESTLRTAAVEAKLLSLLLPPNASILDMCCGVGRHSLELAKLGFHVTGVDITSSYLQQARIRAEQEGLSLDFVEGDMRDFRRLGAFDAVLSMSTSFGFFESEADELRVVANFRASLKPGGTLVMDLMGKEVLVRNFIHRDWCEVGDSLVAVERRVSRYWTWIEERWIVYRSESAREYRMAYRPYSAAELITLLRRAGFSSFHVFGDLGGTPYDQDAKRLVVKAEVQS